LSRFGIGEWAIILTVVAAAAILCSLGTRALIPMLLHRQVLDRPNARSSHGVPTPRGGGLAPVCVIVLAWAISVLWGSAAIAVLGALLAAGMLAAVSWIDDLRGLSPAARLPVQAAAVAIGLAVLAQEPLLPRAVPAAALWLGALGLAWMWWVNVVNFMDGIDGIAGSEMAAIGAGLLLFAGIGVGLDFEAALLAAPVTGAAIGFLVWNWSPARVFLGDVGSVPLGYLTGYLLLSAALRGHWRVALILPLYFLADATITLARRLLRGERVWRAHREHFYQRAVQRGLPHAAVVMRVIAADLVLVGCGWAAENGAGTAALAIAVVAVVALLAVLAHGRPSPAPRARR
jgi:UDP-N-acetylmuramyl pentapeptide phosphotransferase/UDP-N-acetylglucosamine-1-phosphate transferase